MKLRSRFELKVDDILRAAGLRFKTEYAFPDLYGYTNHPLR